MLTTPASSPARGRSSIASRALAAACGATLALQIGCYSYLPVQSTPPMVAQEVGIVISDRGRVLLGDRVGATVDRIDGRVVSRQNGTITLDVYRVTDLRGSSATWTGERVSIPEEAVMGYQARKFSKFKTLVLVGAIAMAIVTTLGRSLDIFGDPEGPPAPEPPISS
jgi:hypothetical protein